MHKNLNDFLHALIDLKKINAQQIADIINVTRSGIYKKLNGSSSFLWEEVLQLQAALGFSLDDFSTIPNTEKINFTLKEFILLDTPENTVHNYVAAIDTELSKLSTFTDAHIYYAAKDLPVFCFFYNDYLTSFKLYFWYKTFSTTKDKQIPFSFDWLNKDTLLKAKMVYNKYSAVNSTEIWNKVTLNSTLHQVEYCVSTGLITKEQAKQILNSLNKYIDWLDESAANEKKDNNTHYKIYFTEVLLLDNSVIFETPQTKIFYLPYSTLNFVSTTDQNFTAKISDWRHQQIIKSTLISGAAEKERIKFISFYKGLIQQMLDSVDSMQV